MFCSAAWTVAPLGVPTGVHGKLLNAQPADATVARYRMDGGAGTAWTVARYRMDGGAGTAWTVALYRMDGGACTVWNVNLVK